MRVFSLSPYFGEDEVLEIKIAEQAPFVDVFAFVEARQNHQGNPRELTWNHSHTLPVQNAEIRYAAISLPSSMLPWEREGHQRQELGALAGDVEPDDLVIISDLDEILRGSVIEDLREREYTLPAQIAFPIHPYRLDYQWTLPVESGWCQCTAVSGLQFHEYGAQRAVKEAAKYTILTGDYGWHFTYQGDAARIVAKAKAIADGWTGDIATLEKAERAIEDGADVFGRDRPSRLVPLSQLPDYVQQNQAKFRHLLRGGTHAQAKNQDQQGQDQQGVSP